MRCLLFVVFLFLANTNGSEGTELPSQVYDCIREYSEAVRTLEPEWENCRLSFEGQLEDQDILSDYRRIENYVSMSECFGLESLAKLLGIRSECQPITLTSEQEALANEFMNKVLSNEAIIEK